jgi:translation elongation factor EF-1alpha
MLKTTLPVALEKFEVLPILSQFTLRDNDKTIGVGKVLKYLPYGKKLNRKFKKEEREEV